MIKLDALLHPVRMRIVQTLLPNEELTVQEIAQKLDDVAPATLYRQIKKLKDSEIIEIRHQQQIRGTTENRYGLAKDAFQTSAQDLNELPKEQHLRYFSMFMAFLQAEFERYLSTPQKDFEKDGMGYRYVSAYMSDEEFHEWIQEYRTLIGSAVSKSQAPGRKKRTLAHIFIPGRE